LREQHRFCGKSPRTDFPIDPVSGTRHARGLTGRVAAKQDGASRVDGTEKKFVRLRFLMGAEMIRSLIPIHKPKTAPRSHTVIEQRERLEEIAIAYAAEPLVASEEELDSLTNEAIGEWRLQDATFWQRVKFRARMIRATEQGRKRRPH
jgi:hypothetical protein